MAHKHEGAVDTAHVGDVLTAHREAAVVDETSLRGKLIIERFTPQNDMEPMRLDEIVRSSEVLRRSLFSMYLGTHYRHEFEVEAEIRAELVDLDAELKACLAETLIVPNLITQVGDQLIMERGTGIAGPPGQVTGMRLGTGVTAPSKTGAGAAIVTYEAGSFKAIDGGFPTSSLVVASRQIQWKTSWGAGVVNGSPLAEAVITNESPLTDVAGSAANTASRSLFGPMTLGALDTLSITWNWLGLGA